MKKMATAEMTQRNVSMTTPFGLAATAQRKTVMAMA